jgi:hypothetical protein
VENFLIFDFEFYWRQICPDFLEIYTNLYKVEQMKEQSLRNLGFIKQYELIALEFVHFFWPLCCLFFFDLRILINPLVPSKSSYAGNAEKMIVDQSV